MVKAGLKLPDNINGYLPVPVQVGESASGDAIYHFVYMRRHQAHSSTAHGKNDERTVFAANLPADSTLSTIKAFCQGFGGSIVEKFIRDDNVETNGQIILVDKAACNRVLSFAKKIVKGEAEPFGWQGEGLNGTEKYLDKYLQTFPEREGLQSHVDEYMQRFAKAEEQKLREVQKMVNRVDDDGFTLVVSSKRKSKGGIGAEAPVEEVVSKPKKRNPEKTDFYKFQIRQQKKEKMNDLLRKFKNDQEKVRQLKESRRFTPY
ncbi:hypothetical protein NADFUDRAFT_82588 [Nadsonia fulvescens var. elongata DSM 6958]|uniref:Ribosomal RNA-processing protein 7 C-terminal domain-containing protein n=1 Tax=Nadsonia fulvescens var. elongata DSM 6958 TaxID=857566 RepID=A0A1E3PJB9_9ASCO|nr:hypothetical protein NADFUDRAFT_82588 [Nadsonia fulvescens var. elongata DSM 6958]